MALNNHGFLAWVDSEPSPAEYGPNALSCPSTNLCVALDGAGRIFTSSSPTNAASWTAIQVLAPERVAEADPNVTRPSMPLGSLACPSSQLCVAATLMGQVATGTGLGTPAAHWSVGTLFRPREFNDPEASPAGVTCPTTNLCVASSDRGVFASTDPAGGAATWHLVSIAEFHFNGTPPNEPSRPTCPSANLCLLAPTNATNGAFDVSTNPGARGSWKPISPKALTDGLGGEQTITCASPALCLTVNMNFDHDGNNLGEHLVTSTNPADTSSWKATTLGVDTPSCPLATLCMTHDGNALYVSTDPAGGASTWIRTPMNGLWELFAPTCTSSNLCFFFDGSKHVYTSTNPGAADTWVQNPIPDDPSLAACPSASACVALTDSGKLLTNTNPAASAWASAALDPPGCTADPTRGCVVDTLHAGGPHGTRPITTTSGSAVPITSVHLTTASNRLSWHDRNGPHTLTVR